MITLDVSPIPGLSLPALTRFLRRAQAAIALPGQVDVLLTSDAELKRLNRTFRGKNKPTDVLSFPPLSQTEPLPILPPEATDHAHAGDLAISLDTAARQAAHFAHPLEVELRILLLHGLLHLAGHDHETDSGEMAALESSLRNQLKLPTSLIARTLKPPSAAKPRAAHPTPEIQERGAKKKLASPAANPKPRGPR